MALPGDVTTFSLTTGPYVDPVGGDLTGITGKLRPVDPVTFKPLRLVHVGTGQAILPEPITVTAGTPVGPLPHTDNPSLSIVGWVYELTWDIGRNKPSPGNKVFAAPTAAGGSVDFDLLEAAESVPGVVVPVGKGEKGDPGSILTEAEIAASPIVRAALGSPDPVLSDFVYDPVTGNLLSYKEDGVPIVLTYNADGTVATSKRGTAPAKTYSYSGGNLVGVA